MPFNGMRRRIESGLKRSERDLTSGAFTSSLESRAQNLSRSIEAHPGVWLAYFGVFYLASTVARSLAKPLWFDEIFTHLIARLPRLRDVVEASWLDNNPPLSYALSHVSKLLFGEGDLALRVPAIAGYLIMSVCLFFYLKRRCSGIYALTGTLFPLVTGAYPYAYEARPYGIVVGLAGVAFLSWQIATSGRGRALGLTGLALSSVLVTAAHYYGTMALLPLAMGEAVRSWGRRRVDIAVWGCVGSAALPAIWLARHAGNAASSFAALTGQPGFLFGTGGLRLISFYQSLLFPATIPLLACLLFYVATRGGRGRDGEPDREPIRINVPGHEVAAACGLCFLPVLVLAVSGWTTGYFMDRYALSAVLGCAMLITYGLSRAAVGRAGLGLVFATAAFVLTIGLTAQERATPVAIEAGSGVYPTADGLPVVIANPLLFLQTVHYGSTDATARCVYLFDRSEALKQPDLIPELVLPNARKWGEFNLEAYEGFRDRHERFWVLYSGNPTLEWLPRRLLADGRRVEFRGYAGGITSFLISSPR